ncbi:MAG: hypothetical protein ABIR96_09600 [Bdellovibrionota bacterium]
MKHALMFAVTVFGMQCAQAGSMDIQCEAFRISKDTNKNVQVLKADRATLELYDTKNYDIIDNDLSELTPGTTFTAKYKNSKSDDQVNVVAKVLRTITEANGHIAIGREHDIGVYKVSFEVSNGTKTQKFEGTCRSEVISTCGGACADESEIRDQL